MTVPLISDSLIWSLGCSFEKFDRSAAGHERDVVAVIHLNLHVFRIDDFLDFYGVGPIRQRSRGYRCGLRAKRRKQSERQGE